MTKLLITLVLFFITAIAEIVSCYLGYLMLKQHKPALAHCTYDHHACPVRMATDPSSHRDRASVCRIWWHIYHDGFGMAKICRWRFFNALGQHWRFGDTVGRNYHYPAAQKFVITLCNQQIC